MINFNRFFLLICMLSLIVVTSGCGLIPIDLFSEEEEPLLEEVLQNAQSKMDSVNGYHIMTRGQVSQTIQQISGIVSKSNFSFENDQRINNKPPAMHSILKEQPSHGGSVTKELYIIDGYIYTNVGSKWIRVNYPNSTIVHSSNPRDLLRFVAETKGEGVSLGKEPGFYVLKLNRLAGKRYLDQLFSETVNSFRAQGIYLRNSDFQTSKFEQNIWIDDQSFKFKKMRTDLTYTVYYNGRTITSDNRYQIDYQGDYHSRIQLPEYVKNNVRY